MMLHAVVNSHSHHHPPRCRSPAADATATARLDIRWARSLLSHEIDGQLASELDKAVVTSFGDDENVLNV